MKVLSPESVAVEFSPMLGLSATPYYLAIFDPVDYGVPHSGILIQCTKFQSNVITDVFGAFKTKFNHN